MRKYRFTTKQLREFASDKGILLLRHLDLPLMREFRQRWLDGPLSAAKKLERLRSFFHYAQENRWIDENPAKNIKSPERTFAPTMPFTRNEIAEILAACERYPDNYGRTGQSNARRLRAFALLLRYSGLRIGDAATLCRERLQGSRLFLYTAKTNVPVHLLLPEFVVGALALAPLSESYFFWKGRSLVETVTGNWRRSLQRLFEMARIKNGHPHRFRDTCAVELLAQGVSLEQVSVLLGHSSIKITERLCPLGSLQAGTIGCEPQSCLGSGSVRGRDEGYTRDTRRSTSR